MFQGGYTAYRYAQPTPATAAAYSDRYGLSSLGDLKTARGTGNSDSYLVLLETCMTTEEEAPEN